MRQTLLATGFIFSLFLPAGLAASPYDIAILADRPVLYLPLNGPQGTATEPDLSPGNHPGRYFPQHTVATKTRLPNGDLANVFDGFAQYLEVRSEPSFSVSPGHALTLEAWIRPDTLEFPSAEGDGYVHWIGKGESGRHEYACRIYSLTNSASPSRPNRISGYAFNPQGGLGSGSYFQDPVRVGTWIHVAVVIDARAPSPSISIFKNGALRKTTPLSQFGVVPVPGDAPVRIGTRDMRSFFKGAIGKFALYHRVIPESLLRDHVRKMTGH